MPTAKPPPSLFKQLSNVQGLRRALESTNARLKREVKEEEHEMWNNPQKRRKIKPFTPGEVIDLDG